MRKGILKWALVKELTVRLIAAEIGGNTYRVVNLSRENPALYFLPLWQEKCLNRVKNVNGESWVTYQEEERNLGNKSYEIAIRCRSASEKSAMWHLTICRERKNKQGVKSGPRTLFLKIELVLFPPLAIRNCHVCTKCVPFNPAIYDLSTTNWGSGSRIIGGEIRKLKDQREIRKWRFASKKVNCSSSARKSSTITRRKVTLDQKGEEVKIAFTMADPPKCLLFPVSFLWLSH